MTNCVAEILKGENKMFSAILGIIFLMSLITFGVIYSETKEEEFLEKAIRFELATRRIVVGHYRRFKRKIVNRIVDRKVIEICEKF